MHSTREDWLTQAVEELRPLFQVSGFPLPDKIRVTCGFPSSKARALHRAIGEHWSPSASASGHHEILISPVMDDPLEVFGILVHELCHAATDGDGHGREFAKIARAMWLEGKLTETKVGTTFAANMDQLIKSLGDYPHSKLNVNALRKPQATRMLKAVCPDCGYIIRVSKAWADQRLPKCEHPDGSQYHFKLA